MLKVIGQERARFRVQIYDLKEKKSRTISVTDHHTFSVDDLKKYIIICIGKMDVQIPKKKGLKK